MGRARLLRKQLEDDNDGCTMDEEALSTMIAATQDGDESSTHKTPETGSLQNLNKNSPLPIFCFLYLTPVTYFRACW